MGTIAENLLALQETKQNFKTSFENKGVDLTDVPFTEYPNKLEELKENLDTELTEQETLLNELEEDVNALSDKDDTALKILDGTLEEFDNTKIGVTSLVSYRFNDFTNLKKVNFTGITEIPQNTCYDCKKVTDVILDNNTTKIGDYAFYYNDLTNFLLNSHIPCELGAYAFSKTKIKGVTGVFSKIGNYAFANPNATYALTNVDITINGSIGMNGFQNAYYVNNFKISKDSNITSLGEYCFKSVGNRRESPENNVFNLDLSNSSFTSIPGSCFSGDNNSYKNKYWIIKFPKTLTSIRSSVFVYTDNFVVYFSTTTPATLNSGSFNTSTNLKIFVPYSVLNTYKTATNWVSYANYIYGYAEENTFEQGAVLPTTNDEGLTLTWYSDEKLTVQVTSVDDPSKIYYCVGV